ncbi:hypothetical protein ACHQM5_030760 [Ranunculus cassubicifolius]
MVHPFSDPEGRGADPWRIVLNNLDGQTLVNLSLVNHQFGSLILEDDLLWQQACFNYLKIPLHNHPPIDSDWKGIYANLLKVREGDPILLGGIFVEETSLIVTAQLDITSLNVVREQGDSPIGYMFTNVRGGLWVVNQFSERCEEDGCGKNNIVLEACVVDYYMTDDYKNDRLDWDERHVSDVPSTSVDCGFFVPTKLSDASSVEVASPNLWGWGNIWEITSKRAPYAVGSTQRTNLQGSSAYIMIKIDDDEVLAFRIVSFLPVHDHDHEG